MRKLRRLRILPVFSLFACIALGQTIYTTGRVTATGVVLFSTPNTNDCSVPSPVCVQIPSLAPPTSIDPYFNGAFSGYADPTEKLDALSGNMWMGYSYLTSTAGAGTINSHIIKTLNNGLTWSYVGNLYPSETATNPTTGVTNYSSNEVLSLYSLSDGAGHTCWFSARLNYWNAASTQGNGAQPYTNRWPIAAACDTSGTQGPMVLSGVTPQYLGTGQNTNPNYPIDVNVQALNAALSGCTSIREPALDIDPDSGDLLIFFGCGNLAFTFVIRAPGPIANANHWTWSYVPGSNGFATRADANSLCAYVNACSKSLSMTELDVNGNYVMATLADLPNGARHSNGCVKLELASHVPPSWVKVNGKIKVDATLVSSDSISGGPGSCTFQPNSVTGPIIANKVIKNAPQNGAFFSFLMQNPGL